MIVEETSDRQNLLPGQQSILFATNAGSVRDYCATHCMRLPDGTPEIRLFDKDSDLGKEAPQWQSAKDAANKAGLVPPYMVASNGKQSFLGPLPASREAALAVLKPIGGE